MISTKNISCIFLLFASGIMLPSCFDNDSNDMYESEFGSYSTLGTITRTDKLLIESDTYGLLEPVNAFSFEDEKADSTGQRVLLDFNFIEKDPLIYPDSIQPVQAVHLYKVLTKPANDVRTNGTDTLPDLSPYGNDPIQINTATISKHHLNIQFYVLGYYADIAHRISLLLTDKSKLGEDGMLTVELRHNAESDLQKEAFWGVVSFELSSIPECNSSQFKGFKIKHTDFTYASAEEDVTFAPTNARSRMIPSNARPLLTKE